MLDFQFDQSNISEDSFLIAQVKEFPHQVRTPACPSSSSSSKAPSRLLCESAGVHIKGHLKMSKL